MLSRSVVRRSMLVRQSVVGSDEVVDGFLD